MQGEPERLPLDLWKMFEPVRNLNGELAVHGRPYRPDARTRLCAHFLDLVVTQILPVRHCLALMIDQPAMSKSGNESCLGAFLGIEPFGRKPDFYKDILNGVVDFMLGTIEIAIGEPPNEVAVLIDDLADRRFVAVCDALESLKQAVPCPFRPRPLDPVYPDSPFVQKRLADGSRKASEKRNH